jgi:Putative Ig domain/Abnormal spindle-like microcephaly-assoc'd, ASPM-SPD-2-Hydin/Transmembrane protein 131-like N-terminal
VSYKRKRYSLVNAPFELMIRQFLSGLPTTQTAATTKVASEERSMAKNPRLCFRILATVIAFASLLVSSASAQYAGQFSWGNSNLNETTLTPQNVNTTKFGKQFSYSVDGSIFAQPLYVPNVAIPGQGTHNVLYVVTENDSAYAFDADGLTPNPLWYTSFINPAQGITAVPCQLITANLCNIAPIIGITGTPAIDTSSNTMYLDTHIDNNGVLSHFLHAIDITTGAEKFGGPILIQASVPGKGIDGSGGTVPFDAYHTFQRPGLLLMNGVIYIPYGNYHGWVLGYNATNLAQLYVFNASPNSTNSNIWQSGAGLTADPEGNIYFATSDAAFDVYNTTKDDYGDSLVKLNSSLQVVDYFTPSDQACRGGHDVDLGSGGPLILPTQPGPYPHEILLAGKGGTPCDLWPGGVYAAPVYVVDYDTGHMGEYNNGNQDLIPQEIEGAPFGYWSNPAYFNAGSTSYVYLSGTSADSGVGDYLKQYTLANGLLSTAPIAESPAVLPDGATPSISASGTSNGIVWAAERQESLATQIGKKSPILLAYNATNVGTLLYSSAQNATRDTPGLETKFMVPLVANGRVYIGTQTDVDAYGVLAPASSATLTPTTLAWGIIAIGSASQAKTATLTNTGSTTLTISSVSVTGAESSEFPITANTCGASLGAGLTCTISVEFKPNAEGTQSATLSVVDGAGTQTSALSGSGTAVKFAPPSLTFTSTAVGTSSSPQSTTMSNLSKSAITITSIAVGGADPADFTQTNTCGSSLAANSSCTITVTFTPTAIGTRTANVTVTDSDVTSPQKLILTGTGTQANVSYTVLPTSIAYPSVNVGLQSSCQPVVVTNTGSTTLTVSSFTLTPFMDFQLQYGYAPKTLSPAQTSTYCIKFVPQAAQAYTGQLSISIQGVANPSIVTFTGTGVTTTAVASVSPNVLTFAPQPLGTTTSQTVKVTNTGKAAFHLSSITNEPPFSYSGFTTSVAIQPNTSFSFQVNFTPTQAISYTNATYLSMDIIPGQSVSMTGSGTAPSSLAVTSFPTLPTVTQKATYLANLAAGGGTGNLTWSLAAGSTLPSGLTLSSTGSITGTPASTVAVGTYTFTAKVTDSASHTATALLTLPVAAYVTGAKCSNIDWDVAGTNTPLEALTDLGTGTYLGYEGGLYPNGQNTPPPAQLSTALSYAQSIASGQSPYVMISVGVSITRTIWDEFGPMEVGDPALNPNLVLVNAAIDGTDSPDWTSPTAGTWLTITNNYLPYQNVTANQVVAAWIMMPHSNQSGIYPNDMQNQENDLIAILQNLHTYFPNLQLAYVSSLHYGGYQPSNSYPEPYAYEFGLAVQNVIADQINGNPALNNNPANGPVMAPLLLWGPYNWANGLLGRNDGLTYDCQDVTSDGLHPSSIGRNKMAGLLSTFFRSDPTATPWFLKP